MFWKKKIKQENFSVEVKIENDKNLGISGVNIVFNEGKPALSQHSPIKNINIDHTNLIKDIQSKNNSQFLLVNSEILRKKIYLAVLSTIREGEDNKTLIQKLTLILPNATELKDSIDSIASTETVYLYQRELILKALESNAIKKQWQAYDSCTKCEKLNGKIINIEESYERNILHPPLHENCKCGLRMIFPEELK